MAEILNPSERWNGTGRGDIIFPWSHFDRYNPRYLNGMRYNLPHCWQGFHGRICFRLLSATPLPSYSIHHEVWWIEFRGRKAQSRSIERLWIKVNHVKFTINPEPRGGAWERGKFNFTRILVEKSFVRTLLFYFYLFFEIYLQSFQFSQNFVSREIVETYNLWRKRIVSFDHHKKKKKKEKKKSC